MENPAYWGPVVTLINDVHGEHLQSVEAKEPGPSLGMRMYTALRQAGFLSDHAVEAEEQHADAVRKSNK